MKVLIAGCNGHLGREITLKAVERNMQVRCFDLAPPKIAGVDASTLDVVTGDITDLETVKNNSLNR